MKKNVIIIILVVVIIVLGYMLMVSFPKKAEAQCTTECAKTVQTQVTSAVSQYQQVLQQLMQIPACASAIPKQ